MRSALLLIFALLALSYAPQTEASGLGCDGKPKPIFIIYYLLFISWNIPFFILFEV
jgi:hypothetical protein